MENCVSVWADYVLVLHQNQTRKSIQALGSDSTRLYNVSVSESRPFKPAVILHVPLILFFYLAVLHL